LEALRSAASTRRAVLGGSAAALATLATLTTAAGCTSTGQAAAPTPGPEVALLDGAIANEAALLALYEAVLAAHTSLAGRLAPLRDHHSQHLSVLRRHYVPGTNSGTPTAAPTPAATVPGSESRALAALRSAERRAAAARASEVRRAAPGLAQLLASIGACEAGHAQVLT
jgi:hypothetical protein